ncbi:cadherin-like beta sandwich domain-containing protein [Stomatobaculum sp. F0698]|uniref:cadherin-like beta sandwich domain-containing protein n=1 Tax=Stomatobaculum sp. F0698 TaxID=3059030 RepID=UPI00272CD407|nr:cadherin-like beta sandwich domain-containing protein [Stomatobaculum sp. F0698]WLD87654.1 cadherin-like beta sandwich domain-containing protein [Stomatobaculum sp. F0698]
MKRGSVTRAFVCGATAAMFSALIQLSAFALSANIQFSDPSTKVGEEFTVSMHVQGDGAIATTDIALGYDSEKMEFVSGDSASSSGGEISVKSSGSEADVYYSLKFKALQEGTSSVQVKSAKLEDGSSQAATISHQGSASVTIAAGAASEAAAAGSTVETAAAPTEATGPLSSLSLSPGTLNPDFSAGNTAYTAVVGEDVTRIAVTAVPAAEGAKVNVSGNENLKLGENTIQVAVVGSDDSALGTYTITVTKQEGATPETAPIEDSEHVTIGGTVYSIAETFDQTLLPAGYESENFIYGNRSVQAGRGPDEHLHLLYLFAEGGSGNLYFYDDTSRSWSPYVQVGATAKAVSVVPLAEGVAAPEGLVVQQVTLNGKSVDGYIGQKDQGQNYCVFYGMNAKGEKGFYRFDLVEKTLQRYFPGDGPGQNTAELLRAQYKVSHRKIVGLTVALVLAIAAAVYAFLRGGRRKSPDLVERERRRAERRAAREAEEQLRRQEEEALRQTATEEVETHTEEVVSGEATAQDIAEQKTVPFGEAQKAILEMGETAGTDQTAEDLGPTRVLPQLNMSEQVRETLEEARSTADEITAQAKSVSGKKNAADEGVFENIEL